MTPITLTLNTWRYTWTEAKEFWEEYVKPTYVRIMWIVAVYFLLLIPAWRINVAGGKEWNFIFFFFDLFWLGGVLLNPAFFAVGALTGVAFNFPDLSKGLIQGANAWYRIIMAVLFGHLVVMGILSTWGFGENPPAFWVILAGLIVLLVMSQALVLRSKAVLIWLTSAYIVVVGCVYAFGTIPDSWGSKKVIERQFSSEETVTNGSQQPQVVTYQYVPGDPTEPIEGDEVTLLAKESRIFITKGYLWCLPSNAPPEVSIPPGVNSQYTFTNTSDVDLTFWTWEHPRRDNETCAEALVRLREAGLLP